MSDQSQRGQGLFVIGCPRSGTYLLSTLLSTRFGVALPLETHFIPLFARFLPLWGDLANKRNRKALMSDIIDFLTIWAWASRELDCREDRSATLLGVRDDSSEVAAQSRSYGEMIEGLFSRFAASRGMLHWADKSAFYRSQPLARFQRAVPTLKVIHCVRDPRDVVLSWRRIWCGPKTVTEAALAWKEHVLSYRDWGLKNPDRYHEFRYEDLLDDPDGTLTRLGDFLELPLLDDGELPAAGQMVQTLGKLKTHSMLGGAIRSDNKEKWRREMTEEDVAMVEWLASDAISAFEYPLSGEGSMPSGGWKRRLFESTQELLSTRRMQLLVKDLLPLCLRIKSLLGIPLPRRFFRLDGRADKVDS
jgi:hypothetical protein